MAAKKSSRYRDWCFTINKPKHKVKFTSKMKYLVFQLEKSQKGTPHYQGFVQFKREKSRKTAKKIIGQHGHFERRRAKDVRKAADYCKKEESRLAGPFEYGVMSQGQGTRTDVKSFRDLVLAGKNRKYLIMEEPFAMQKFERFYKMIKSTFRPDHKERKVVLLYGVTGAGKTRSVTREAWADKEYWKMPVSNGTVWFDGYDGEEFVLIDDFGGKFTHCPLGMLLRILHEEPESMPIKGGFVWFNPSIIIITTNIHPKDWYDFSTREEQYSAIKRRFNSVWLFKKVGEDAVKAKDSWWEEVAAAPTVVHHYHNNNSNAGECLSYYDDPSAKGSGY